MPAPLSTQQLWYGRDEPPVLPRAVSVGAASAEIHGIDVRRMRWGAVPLVDRIYVAVRDLDWGTLPPAISNVEVGSDETSPFLMRFDASNRAGDIRFDWKGSIGLAADGVLTYDMDGVAVGGFRYNRIGICVLHPAGSSAGRPFTAQTPTGVYEGRLPELIAPQSIVDGHEVALFPAFNQLVIDMGELAVRIDFQGDLFETEDQRNWTDDSFKTYSGPISLGYPHDATDGQRIHHRIVVTPLKRIIHVTSMPGDGPVARVSPAVADITVGEESGAWPAIGLGQSSDAQALGHREVDLLRAVAPDHLRVDLHLGDDWAGALGRADADARALGCALEVACYADEASLVESPELGRRLRSSEVARVLAFHEASAGTGTTPPGWLARLRDALGPGIATIPCFVGTDGDFAEINRDRPDLAGAAGVCYSANPQIHAYDELSMAETLPAQAATVVTARSFAAGGLIALTPVTLKQRFNPAADPDAAAPAPDALPAAVDVRVPSLFGAGWALGSLASLIGAGTSSLTYFETAGWRGLLEWAEGVSRPSAWPALHDVVYPLYHLFADLGDRQGRAPVVCSVADPSQIAGLAMRAADGASVRLLVANLTPSERHLTIVGLPPGDATLRVLDATNAAQAMASPHLFRASGTPLTVTEPALALDLRPFAYARLDVGSST